MTGRPSAGDAEEDARPVPIEEEQVPERLHLPRELEVIRVAGVAVEDQVGQDGLLLLPEVLGVAPGELDRPAIAGLPLDRVEAAAAELVDPDLGHALCRAGPPSSSSSRPASVLPLRLVEWATRVRFQAIFRLCPTTARFCCQPQEWSGFQLASNRSLT